MSPIGPLGPIVRVRAGFIAGIVGSFLLNTLPMNYTTLFHFRPALARLLAGAAGVLCFSTPLLQAAPALPPLSPADGLGVNIHFTDPQPGEMEMIAAAGFKWVRMDLTWSQTEKVKGKYDFSAYDRLLAALDKQKMHALLILNYGNPLYADPGDKSPFTSRVGTREFHAAFTKWAAAAVSRFAGRGCIWEMWNEPNYKGFWAPAPSATQYAALAKATAAAVHAAAPGEPMIGPASSTFDFNFLEACFKAGLLENWSAVSVHPYREAEPATAAVDFQRLRDLIAKYAPKGKAIPIISSEWGYSTTKVDEATQADYIVREFSSNLAAGIPLSIWYDWHDDGDDPANAENRFGLVRHQYHAGRDPVYDPKPSYLAIKAFAAKLRASAAH